MTLVLETHERNNVVSTSDEWALIRPTNPMATNYQLIERESGKRWLIDHEDVALLDADTWAAIRDLKDIDLAKELAWKTI